MPKLSERQIGQLIGGKAADELAKVLGDDWARAGNRIFMALVQATDQYGTTHERAIEIKVTVRQMAESGDPNDSILDAVKAWEDAKTKEERLQIEKTAKIERDKAKRAKVAADKKATERRLQAEAIQAGRVTKGTAFTGAMLRQMIEDQEREAR